MSRIKGLRVCIDVDDLDRAIAFYRDVLALEPGRRLGKHWVEMLGAPVVIDLLGTPSGSAAFSSSASSASGHSSESGASSSVASSASPGSLVRRDFARHWTPVHLDFVVEDLDAAVARALRAGASLDREVMDRPYGRLANLADPFGHGFCLIEMNERGYDALLTEPEDLGDE